MTAEIRLSRFILPEVRMGAERLTPQNMTPGLDRLRYAHGLARHIDILLRTDGLDTDVVHRFLDGVPLARDLVRLELQGGRVAPRLRDGVEDLLHFAPERLQVVLADGRKRRARDMICLETGTATQAFGRLIAALGRGIARGELFALAGALGVDMDETFVDALIAEGALEVTRGACAEAGPVATGDRVTWLGHAAVMFQSGDATVWVDPHLLPVLRWHEGEAAEVFSPAFAEARLFSPHGPNARQISALDLPIPDAVLITHQDVDHCNLGVLMTLPATTRIIVPEARPHSPWDIDLARLVRTVLGEEREVIALGHGRSLDIGPMRITAFPFGGEMPVSLPHAWNCYLVETRRSVVAFTADSAIGDEQIAYLCRSVDGRERASLLFARTAGDSDGELFGWRENGAAPTSAIRLWTWYAPVAGWFDPVPEIGVSYGRCRELAAAGWRHVFPYAVGSAPWLRFHDPAHFFWAGVGSLSLRELDAIEAGLSRSGLRMPPLRYGVPFPLDATGSDEQ